MRTFHWVTPIAIAGSSTTTWVGRDLDTYVAGLGADVTGVLLYVYNDSASTAYSIGFRKKDSADNRTASLGLYHTWAFAGVNADHEFQIYATNANIKIYIIGYTTTGIVFYDNGVNVTPAITGSYQDLPALPEGAIAGIYEFRIAAANVYSKGIRPKGSADDFYNNCAGYSNFGAFVGCNIDKVVQVKISNVLMEIGERGYVTDGAVFLENGTDYSQANTGVLEDLAALPDGAEGGFFTILNPNATTFQIKGKDDVFPTYKNSHRINNAFVRNNTDNLISSKIASNTIDYYLTGYSLGETLASNKAFGQNAQTLLLNGFI
jgi:hypothetical protein